MPILDMPLKELKEYQGINPKPNDFDDYWARGLKEIENLDPQVELRPATFQVPGADCFDLYFTSTKGSRIYAKYLRPKKIEAPVPGLVQFHGYSLNSGDWWDKLAFVNQGFAIAAMDCRGQGGKSENRGDIYGPTQDGLIIRGLSDHEDTLVFRDTFLDTVLLTRILMSFKEVDEKRIGALGGSQGGALALACAALEPRIKLVSAMYPFLSDFQRVWEMDIQTSAYQELRNYFRSFDPTHERETELFTKLGYIDIQFLAERIQGSVLWACGLMDNICPPSSQFATYNKIKSQKRMIVYPDFTHEGLPGFGDETMSFLLELQKL